MWWGHAEQELAAFATWLSIPVLFVPYHQPLHSAECPAYCGLADMRQFQPAEYALQNVDLVLTIGCRLDNMLNFGDLPFVPAKAHLVCVNGSADEVTDNHAADVSILGHPQPVLSQLAQAVKSGPICSAHNEVRVPAANAEGGKKLAGYMLRAPMCLEKMTHDAATGTVIYRSKMHLGLKWNFQVMPGAQ